MGALGVGFGLAQRRRKLFDPARLFAGGEQGMWYDPSDLGSMFQDAGGTVAAAVDAPVGLIRDKSGRANHAVQSAAAARPVLRRDAGGRLYLAFDGVDDFLATASAVPVMAQPVTAVLAATFGEGAAAYQRVFDASPGHASRLMFGRHGATTLAYAGAVGPSEAASFPHPLSVWGLVFDGAGSVMRRGGVQRASGNPGEGSLGGVTVGAGNYQGTAEFMAGRIYGLLIAARALGPDQLGAAERWAAARAGVAF